MENSDTSLQALLLQPPPGDLTGPYPALGYLKSYANQQGFRVMVKDLGIEALHYLVQPPIIETLLQKVKEQWKELKVKYSLDPLEQTHYQLLLSILALGKRPEWFGETLKLFQDKDRFFDYREYQKARLALNAFFGILSAVHFPTNVTASEYPTAGGLKTWPAIQAQGQGEGNPYLPYYEKILFPLLAVRRPIVVGISMVFASQSVQALVLGNLIKKRFPEIHVTMGGAYFSQWVSLQDESRLETFFQYTDSIIIGEGEIPFSRLLISIKKNQGLEEVPNLIFRHPLTGKIHRATAFEYTNIIDQPPPDFSDLNLSAYLTPQIIIPYSISRGCYWGKCVFCQNRYGDRAVRRYQVMPVDKAIQEMSALTDQYGSNHFNFSNDVIDPFYLKRFSQAVESSGRHFIWNTDVRAEAAFNKKVCQGLARAGLNAVAIGFESGCQKVLEAMDKGNRVTTTRQVLKNLYQSGIATQVMGFFGFPGETETDGEKTVQFLEENIDRISYYVMGLLLVLPGSRMYQNPERFRVSLLSYEGNSLMTPEPVWKSEGRMSPTAVNRLFQRLSRLEDVYRLDDYPYVGGLSTNHSFLYFKLGPGILKTLRKQEKEWHRQQMPEG